MTNPGIEFLEKTRYPDFSTVDMILRRPEPEEEMPVQEGADVIRLPDPKRIKIPDVSVRKAFEEWEPEAFFSRSSITLKELSFLLWSIQGYRKIKGNDQKLRNVPSSGLRYPIETFFVAGEVEGLETGLYRYLPHSHQIVAERVDSTLPFAMGTASMNFKLITRAAVTFLWVGIPYRSTWALGNRGFRSVLIEVGHICQALIMAASCIGCRVHPIDLFHDQIMIQLADLNPETQWPLYVGAVGKRDRDL
ncbi:MAG: SagB/ThcOx family dehydrogenase [Methanomicrobiaceae archaeon]|nr:SagB/ThcOx family dehydrogenase [Methanomicrobiaceae archaeon]